MKDEVEDLNNESLLTRCSACFPFLVPKNHFVIVVNRDSWDRHKNQLAAPQSKSWMRSVSCKCSF
jgi:hypothetical protein